MTGRAPARELGRTRLERHVEGFAYAVPAAGRAVRAGPVLSWPDRMRLAHGEVATALLRIWPYPLVGIALGAVIHGWAPEAFFVTYAGPGNPFANPDGPTGTGART